MQKKKTKLMEKLVGQIFKKIITSKTIEFRKKIQPNPKMTPFKEKVQDFVYNFSMI
jgi:hypothetical protein